MINRGMKRSLLDFKRHPWLHLVSILTIGISLLLLGVFFLCYRNFESIADKTSGRSTGTVYLKETLPEVDLDRLRDRINSLSAVKHIAFLNKRSILEDLQSFLGKGTSIDSLAAGDVFPDVLELELRREATSGEIADLKSIIEKMPEVAEVDFSADWLDQVKRIRHFLEVFGLLLMTGIVIGCGFIIANFMGMRHQSRKNEIDIVRLHGAYQNFVLAPFLWEGAIEGILGSTLALFFLFAMKEAFSLFLSPEWSALLGVRGWLFLSAPQVLLVLFIGISMAFFGSFAVFLRFQENSPR